MRIIFFIFFIFLFPLLAPAQKNGIAQKGEGIYAFLRRNGCSEKDYSQFIKLNKDNLGKDNSLILGVSYLLPSSETKSSKKTDSKIKSQQKEPLFGKEHEAYAIESNRLKGALFFLVSGHGGPDSGAVAKVGGKELHEDEYAYDIVLRLAKRLLENGAAVHVIIQDAKDGIRDNKYLKNSKRETCMGKPIPWNQKKRLKQRTDKINELSKKAKEKYKRTIFIHLDSRSKKKQLDVFFYYQKENKKSKQLAETMQKTFRNKYNDKQGRGYTGTISTEAVYVMRNTKPVSIFAELANMQNEYNQKRYLDHNNRQALANWLLQGFIQDYEANK
ncbi:MAG: N-acetylmuramoyl-L-alanine amidase [Dysgonamonadaceae bacterium]|jgi:N-acetylmuramoyl-L-alanine amidase|nr:N-acetylmuramoyl-L-alanine amidase [Dysgonamonadaceae bacterium]